MDKIKDSEYLVSIEQLAKIWGVSRVQIHRYVSEGRIKGVTRIGTRLVFDLRVVKYPEPKRRSLAADRNIFVQQALKEKAANG